MKNKSFAALFKAAQQNDDYWSEQAKIEVAVAINGLLASRAVSRAQLAKKIGVSAPYITKALSGDANLSIATMARIAHALGARLHIDMPDKEADVRWFKVIAGQQQEVGKPRLDWRSISNLPTVMEETAHAQSAVH